MTTAELDFDQRLRLVDAEQARLAARAVRVDRLRGAMVDAAGLEDMPEPTPLVGSMLYLDSLAWLYGPPGCCKSFIALDLAGCIGTGEPWQGQGTTIQGTVLYLVAEGVTGIKKRVRAWESAMGSRMAGVRFLPVAVQASNASEWEALIDLAIELKPLLIVVDTQARVTVGIEENSATEMGKFVDRVEALRSATGSCVLVIHHTGRNGEHLRGSIAIDGAATTLIKVTRTEELIEIECPKQKDGAEFAPLRLRLIEYGGSAILSLTDGFSPSTVDSPATRKIIGAWWDSFETDWVSIKVLCETTGAARATLFRHMKALEKAGLVESAGERTAKRYRLTRNPGVSSVSAQSHVSLIAPGIEESQSQSLTPFKGETRETPTPDETGPKPPADTSWVRLDHDPAGPP